jgi:UV DNA damage endonuclease
MKIGYPCINLTVDCQGNKTFRIKSYSEEKIIETVENNLRCLIEILKFNVKHDLYFFRISSDLVPFASHPNCGFKWEKHFAGEFKYIGDLIRQNEIRISMHPDQFTLINSPDRKIYGRSVSELLYHSKVLDCMGLDLSAKIQIHIGGVYGDKNKSMERFVRRYEKLDTSIRGRLVIENDDRSYSLRDCICIFKETGIPILFDVFHHEIFNSGETLEEAFKLFERTWRMNDGIPMVDYSSQGDGQRIGRHVRSIDIGKFRNFMVETRPFDFDVMLEIKDKERSAIVAVKVALSDGRFYRENLGRKMHYG